MIVELSFFTTSGRARFVALRIAYDPPRRAPRFAPVSLRAVGMPIEAVLADIAAAIDAGGC